MTIFLMRPQRCVGVRASRGPLTPRVLGNNNKKFQLSTFSLFKNSNYTLPKITYELNHVGKNQEFRLNFKFLPQGAGE